MIFTDRRPICSNFATNRHVLTDFQMVNEIL